MGVPESARAKSPRPVPTTGMRGGLGRTLLTAFLILAIGPLSLVSYLAFDRVRSDQQQRAIEKLVIVADLISAELQDWAKEQASGLRLISSSPVIEEITLKLIAYPHNADAEGPNEPGNQIYVDALGPIAPAYYQGFESIWLLEAHSQRVWSILPAPTDASAARPAEEQAGSGGRPTSAPFLNSVPPLLALLIAPSIRNTPPPQLTKLIVGSDGIARFATVVAVTRPEARPGNADTEHRPSWKETSGQVDKETRERLGFHGTAESPLGTGQATLYLVGVAQLPERFLRLTLHGAQGSGFHIPAGTAEPPLKTGQQLPDSTGYADTGYPGQDLRRMLRIYILSQDGQLFSLGGQPVTTTHASPVTDIQEDGEGLYINHADEPVLGAYRWLHDADGGPMDCALLAEQGQESAFAASDQFAASLIAATLGVALLTAIMAAVVTRRLTRPIVHLTEAALRMAEGDLSERVQTDQRDEIGILARVFNKMATDLGELYAGLEKKVAERTRELEEAKAQIQYHAWQLSISAEVGRITTSILELDTLLERAAHLIRDAFQLDHVGIYLLERSGKVAVLRKNAGRAVPAYEQQIYVGGSHPVGWVASRHMLRMVTRSGREANRVEISGQLANISSQCHELALPLAVGGKVIGALDITTYDPAGFSESDQSVLQTLADQLSVAIQNARAYGQEREVIDEMREVDRLRGQFLTRMSHQLATYLNTIIGFSQMMLKGVEGPLTEMQIKDLTNIHQSGLQLAQLLDDIHDLANLEVGTIELQRVPVDLCAFLKSWQTSLVPNRIGPELYVDLQVEEGLPTIWADEDRLRQVLTNLVITAAEMSTGEIITVQAAQASEQIQIAISTPAMNQSAKSNSGINLALSRQLIELHGGRLRIAQYAGEQIIFALNLPIQSNQLTHPPTNLRRVL